MMCTYWFNFISVKYPLYLLRREGGKEIQTNKFDPYILGSMHLSLLRCWLLLFLCRRVQSSLVLMPVDLSILPLPLECSIKTKTSSIMCNIKVAISALGIVFFLCSFFVLLLEIDLNAISVHIFSSLHFLLSLFLF